MALNLREQTVFTNDPSPAQPPLPPEQIAPHFPQLEILECLGRGGMGVVYKARQKTLNRLVALKLLAPERVRDADFAGRFAREAQALAALNHPNIVTVHDFGQAGGFYYLLMEFVDGANLRQLLRTRKFTPEEALAIVPPLCEALQFAHDRGIVHRDIKPENLLLGKDGRLKVADFGVAKMLGAADGGSGETAAPKAASQTAGGTPGYSAPEQMADPRRADSRADIYSLGAVFYELLTGELPGKRIEPPSRKVRIDVRLDAVVLRALEKTPELRWQTALDLRTEVETIVAGGGAEIASRASPGAITPSELRRKRWRITLWGLGLAAASVSMPVIVIRFWGFLLFGVSAALAWVPGNNPRKIRMAMRLISIDGIVVAAAAIWLAIITPDLPTPWLVTLVAGCLCGMGYCASCLAANKSATESSSIPGSSKAKPAIVAGVVMLLAAGITAALVEYSRTPLFDKPVFAQQVQGLANVPEAALQPSTSRSTGITGYGTSLIVARGVSLRALLSYAYGSPSSSFFKWSGHRVILPPGVADGKFDFILAAPAQGKGALQAEIKRQLGLVAHHELRTMDALVLMVPNPGAVELKATNGGNSSDSRGLGKFEFTNQAIGDLSDALEDDLEKPVLNETELAQKYSGSLKWNHQSDPAAELREIQGSLSAQCGLALVPSREPVEMLVVEKVP